jgi:hypothetical protein
MLRSCTNSFSFLKEVIGSIFKAMRSDVGFPGRYALINTKSIFGTFFNSRLKKYLKERNMQYQIRGQSRDCLNTSVCQVYLKKAIAFVRAMNTLFSFRNYNDNEYLKERPDFYLGQFFRMFTDKIFHSNFASENGFDCEVRKFNETKHTLINNMMIEYFTTNTNYVDSFLYLKKEACTNSTQKLLEYDYETFLDIVKYSQIGNTTPNSDAHSDFIKKYVNSSIFQSNTNYEKPIFLTGQIGIMPFCETVTKQNLSSFSLQDPSKCTHFDPILTAKGLCYTFNSMSMTEIFKPMQYINLFTSIFNLSQNMVLSNPSGYGPSHGLTFILNSFEFINSERSSKNFILSITNENNPFDIFKQSYFVEPGNSYTFRVSANQIITNERFDAMPHIERNCLLPKEHLNSNFFRKYSKSSCEYECGIQQAEKECGCIPWYIPRTSMGTPPFCSLAKNNCFETKLNSFFPLLCNCPSDCYETSFSVFESSKKIENPIDYCHNKKLKNEFPFTVFCSMCSKIIKSQRIRFTYENIVNGGPDPDIYTNPCNNNIETFCNQFIKENVAIVKVEMATKFLTRSLKDKRFNFVSQLSSLGKFIFCHSICHLSFLIKTCAFKR